MTNQGDPIKHVIHVLYFLVPVIMTASILWIFAERRIVQYLKRKLAERRRRKWFSKSATAQAAKRGQRSR